MESLTFDLMEQYDYEHLIFCQEKNVGLKAIIAIHNTTLGPAAGGTRMWTYATEVDAMKDAMRLARGMTYKWAAADVNLGGGKCVVIGDPKREKTEQLLRALGRAIQRLNGLFLTGPDVGTNLHDMEIMCRESRYVVAVSESLGGPGDTSSETAFGVIQGMRACLNAVYGGSDLQGRTVAVQGVGAVGGDVVAQLVKAGAIVTITDVDSEKVAQIATAYGMKTVPPEEIYSLPVDVYCPCALGAVLNDITIPVLRCKIICGSANNQLAEDRHGEMIAQREIVYAPDYIVNAGGALTNIDSLAPGGFNRQRAHATVARIYQNMEQLLEISREQGIPTHRAADVLAEQRLARGRIEQSMSKDSEK